MDEDAKTSKAKFKSKWNRVFKEKEEHEQTPKHTNSFKLDEDVADFLKPSTDKAAILSGGTGGGGGRPGLPAPKLDIAIAQRWPDSHEVRKASAGPNSIGSALLSPNGFRKPRRKKGLQVAFVRSVPEIIGEGGDECEEATSEVGRRRIAMRMRAQSDARILQERQYDGEEEEFVPKPLRRVQTSHSSVTPPVGEDVGMSRGTTVAGHDDAGLGSRDGMGSQPVPRLNTTFAPEQEHGMGSGSTSGSGPAYSMRLESPKDPHALAVRKRELRSSEGLALRRVSALIEQEGGIDEDDEEKRQSMGFGVQLPDAHYDTLSRADAPDLLPEPRSATTPRSAKSPLGPSPFDDPKYAKRRSHVILEEEPQPQPLAAAAAAASLRPQRTTYQPSYMRAVQPVQPDPPQNQPPVPAMPQVSPPAEPALDAQPSYMKAATSHNPPPQLPVRIPAGAPVMAAPLVQKHPPGPPPAPSEPMRAPQPQHQPRSRDPSPMRDRILARPPAAQASQPFYAQRNRSSGSLNHFPPSPKHSHSRSSSRDGQSPYSDPSGVLSQPSPTRYQAHSHSPQSNSPRSSIIGRSPLSPPGSSSAAGQMGYSSASKPQPHQTLQPPANLQVDDPSSRPVSASSNRSFSRPLNSFSAPRPHQSAQPPVFVPQQEEELPSATIFPPAQRPPQQVIPPSQGQPQTWRAKSAAANARHEEVPRPGSSGSAAPTSRPVLSPQPTSEGNPAADAAYADFAARVAHMKGVFRLTAEKERPADRCTPLAWVRTALWWYIRGKAGLEVLMQQHRPRMNDGQIRELLAQPHVDLAKTWWILSDPLDAWDGAGSDDSPHSAVSNASGMVENLLKQSVSSIRNHLKSLSLSMSRNQLMPPPQSLIQGQDTTIWVEYPRFTGDAAAVLSGSTSRSPIVEQSAQGLQPLDALPLGDTRDVHCYGRFPVEVAMGTDDASTDRMTLPCVLTMLRGKREFRTTIVVASQNELVSLKIAPRQGNERGLTWHDVSWKASAFGMIVRLPHGYDVQIRMSERDFRSLWNIVEYARKVEHCFRPGQDEKFVYEARLAELQYADSSNANSFPPEKIKAAIAALFERTIAGAQGGVERKMHRGYRLLLVTDPKHKSLASASHEVCKKGPLLFEFITDAAAHGMAAMVLRIREEARQSRILLVFSDVGARQNFYDVLNGIAVGEEEMIVSKMSLASINIEPATQAEGFSQLPHQALQQLQWQKLGVTNSSSDENVISQTVESHSLRVVARHATGCITDRLNLSKGELLLRLPCSLTPSVQILRNPQEDITMSIDTRNSPAQVSDGIAELLRLTRTQSTIRTFTFPSLPDLHAFQLAITGSSVRYDGLAATLSISRRRMVVPIYKKWEATSVRIQIISHSSVVQVLAFIENFSHADALCFQVKSTDTFETIKGDAKGSKKWAVRLVDAKFALPTTTPREKGEEQVPGDGEERVRRRFVNLEGLEYMTEHDDITVGFDTLEERERFAEGLPTAATVGRGFTLKRRT